MTSLWEANHRAVKEQLLDRGWDYVTVYDGPERIGKSTLALQANIEVDDGLREKIEACDFRAALQHTSHDFEAMVQRVKAMPKTGHHYDEASLLAREAMQPWNVRMMKVLSIVGFLNNFYTFNFPNFWDLDPYIRDHRCAARCLVRSFMGERGYATYFVAHKKDFPSGGRKIWWEEAFDCRFTSFDDWSEPYQEFWARYEKQDRNAKMEMLEDGMNDREKAIRGGRDAGLTDKQIAAVMRLSRSRVTQLRSELEID